ncbi:hypothetical protein YC2023_094466 [Brassica napus]
MLETEEYSLITNFPRTVYGRDKESMSLKDAVVYMARLRLELLSFRSLISCKYSSVAYVEGEMREAKN